MKQLPFCVLLLIGFFFYCTPMGWATETISLPILVNLQGFKDKDEREDAIKRIKKNFEDANTVLKENGKKLGKKTSLKIGPVEFKHNPDGPTKVKEGTKAFKDLKREGLKELDKAFKKKFGANKGTKVYIVQVLTRTDGSAPLGLATTGGRVAWFPDGDPESDKEDETKRTFELNRELRGRFPNEVWVEWAQSGHFLVHELIHNAGISDHQESTILDEKLDVGSVGERKGHRTITSGQWDKLEAFFKKYGKKADSSQQSFFDPQDKITHYALVTNPQPRSATDMASLTMYTVGNETLFGMFVWDGLLPNDAMVTLDIALDIDGDPNSGVSVEGLEGADAFVQVNVEGQEDGTFVLNGNLNMGQENGTSNDSYPFGKVGGTLQIFTEVLNHANGGETPNNHALDFSVGLGMFPTIAKDIRAFAVVTNQGGDDSTWLVSLQSQPDPPQLTTLPDTVQSGDTVTVAGQGFSPNSPVRVLWTGATAVDGEEVATTSTQATGAFSVSFTVPEIEGDTYFIEAVDGEGGYAVGVVSASGVSGGGSQPGSTIEEALDENVNGRLDDAEILRAIQSWISGETVGTTGQTIDDAKILALIQLWISGATLGAVPSSPAATPGQGVSVRTVTLLVPSPLERWIVVQGQRVEAVKVHVYDLGGRLRVQSQGVGNRLRFQLQDDVGRPLANGVYLYLVTVHGAGGTSWRGQVGKLLVLR